MNQLEPIPEGIRDVSGHLKGWSGNRDSTHAEWCDTHLENTSSQGGSIPASLIQNTQVLGRWQECMLRLMHQLATSVLVACHLG